MRGRIIDKEVTEKGIVYKVEASIWPAYHTGKEDLPVPFWTELTRGEGDFWTFVAEEGKETKQ